MNKGIGSAFGDKSRLRDEADLALLAYLSAGHQPRRLRPSLAPVCVHGPGRIGSLCPQPTPAPAPDTSLMRP